jgi:hypothetical protein
MAETLATNSGCDEPLPPPRFRWPMRLLLSLVLFDMVFHSFASLTGYHLLLGELGLEHFPKALPSHAEIERLSSEETDNPSPVLRRFGESFAAVAAYLNPWPSETVRPHLQSWPDKGTYLLCWIASRLDFYESLIGTTQHWLMYSPSVVSEYTLPRMRLLFADGSTRDVRQAADPPDLTHYSHWFQEKTLDYEYRVLDRLDSRLGYCNLLAHQYRTSETGAPLTTIYLYAVTYRFPAPDEDAAAVLRAQNGPPGWDKTGPKFVYDVATRTCRQAP